MFVSRIDRLSFIRIYSSTYCCRFYSQCDNDFSATYNVDKVQEKWSNIWKKDKYSSPKTSTNHHFSILLPPPNVTGILHLGHSLTVAIQDSLARWYRMKGQSVAWIPGMDHAGIATQVMVEKYLQKIKGVSRHDLGREEFLLQVNNWKDTKKDVITRQLQSFGASLDWSREYFTMSEKHSRAVTEAFVRLAERELIYREKSIVNWSPSLRSAISDIEVEFLSVTGKTELEVPNYQEKVSFGQITEFSYRLKDSDHLLTVATTRPETMLGDVAVAVHPDDERYCHLIGSHVWHPFRETFIPIIADSFVDRSFGTGAVKITPAHDYTDFGVAKKHNLEIIDVIDEHGNMTSAAKPFSGLPRFVARERVLTELANRNVLGLIKDYSMTIPKCSRSGDIIEYLLKDQWFVNCKEISNRAIEAVKNGTLKIDPPIHEQTWYKWLENIRDWCISRQLWWGHRIPAYLCSNDKESTWIVARSENEALSKAREKLGGSIKIKQDEDVLDTWFSSALLPFSVMGWPDRTDDYQRFYPLSMLETGHDILFFWVARMVMLGTELTGELPFKEVLLHGILCDKRGKKMSKSLGNVITPENITRGVTLQDLNDQAKQNYETGVFSQKELQRTEDMNAEMFPNGIPECGNDALRLTLCSLNIKSHNVNFDVSECVTNKLFCNKIWQASKFVLTGIEKNPDFVKGCPNMIDKWILSRLAWMVATANEAFSERNIHVVTRVLKQFVYHEFCDWYLEATKPGLADVNSKIAFGHLDTLIKCLDVTLRTMAPIAPYLADELYAQLSHRIPSLPSFDSLMEAPYPAEMEVFRDQNVEEKFEKIKKIVSSTRSLISSNRIRPRTSEAHVIVRSQEDADLYRSNSKIITAMSKILGLKVSLETDQNNIDNCIFDTVGTDCSIYLVLKDAKKMVELGDRIENKISNLEKRLKKLIEKTSAPGFITGAPIDVQKSLAEKKDALRKEIEKLSQMKVKNT
ncbi:valine--tRNA ligase-like isoform X2 [Athalia rosae]|uniref:valine--tRNA ligase-like isoform X2 n=1 Tax=Athalia rosae TaxID=37344 RepID=UPI00203335B5|nr:valine--tRNA ligase-like isoform X2 [Athalia rosae]